jgi:hypothetical protein
LPPSTSLPRPRGRDRAARRTHPRIAGRPRWRRRAGSPWLSLCRCDSCPGGKTSSLNAAYWMQIFPRLDRAFAAIVSASNTPAGAVRARSGVGTTCSAGHAMKHAFVEGPAVYEVKADRSMRGSVADVASIFRRMGRSRKGSCVASGRRAASARSSTLWRPRGVPRERQSVMGGKARREAGTPIRGSRRASALRIDWRSPDDASRTSCRRAARHASAVAPSPLSSGFFAVFSAFFRAIPSTIAVERAANNFVSAGK